eukprot:TRINITY_DN1906_c0_g1_i1.p1 TRINITY_DN1906_c0_g1~~TRINITY_DN1906_c0_g1_i1.p1  ORF type:complete len:629 (-),score=165.74 TRINITY_DN1906_c0_g1_i1:86-1972(-)
MHWLCLLSLCIVAVHGQKIPWQPGTAPLMTRWAVDVNPEYTLPDHPRPTFNRNSTSWQSLNGLWECDPNVTPFDLPPFNVTLPSQILVPFPVESALSGIMTLPLYQTIMYRKVLNISPPSSSSRMLLHFEAVDWATTVWINGAYVGYHTGGYDRFSFDITQYLNSRGSQEIIVKVWDPSETGPQPCGKQDSSTYYGPGGITYSPTSGIWQTVWMETVPAKTYISDIYNIPDLDNKQLVTTVYTSGAPVNASVVVKVLIDNVVIASQTGSPNASIDVPIPLKSLYLWTPNTPFLYSIVATLVVQGTVVDTINSYFGMRKIEIVKDSLGIPRAHLNGQPFFQVGTLDQGFWPDGLYTAPTDEALSFDLVAHKLMGFNLVRKHVKVEPERWYYWADVLGLVVWQDMPSGNWMRTVPSSDSYKANFLKELLALVNGPRRNHPCIVQWTLFNEGWGQPAAPDNFTIIVTNLVQSYEKHRLVADCSGWNEWGVGSNVDMHHYPDPSSPNPDKAHNRHAVLGEFGGILLVPNGQWAPGKCHGYVQVSNSSEMVSQYTQWSSEIAQLSANPGLDASVYTQITDVETECNGLLSYDRYYKADPALINRANTGTLMKIEAMHKARAEEAKRSKTININ